jgi:flagellar hook-length control protein FliK
MGTLNVQDVDGDSEPEAKLSDAQASSAMANVLPTPIATLAPTPPSLSNASATPSSPLNATTIVPRAGIDPSLPVTPSSAPAVPLAPALPLSSPSAPMALPIKAAHARDLPAAASMPTPAPSIHAVAPSSLPVTPPAPVLVPGSLAPADGVPVPVTAANADPDSGDESDDESGDEDDDDTVTKTGVTPSSTSA